MFAQSGDATFGILRTEHPASESTFRTRPSRIAESLPSFAELTVLAWIVTMEIV